LKYLNIIYYIYYDDVKTTSRPVPLKKGTDLLSSCVLALQGMLYTIVVQPFHTRGTLNIVEESWWHTDPILHIMGGGDGLWY
jgi:hypothetical protein